MIKTETKFATAGGTATFVNACALSVESIVRDCHFAAPDDESDLVTWIATAPESGAIWESRTNYRHGIAAGLPVFRVKAVCG